MNYFDRWSETTGRRDAEQLYESYTRQSLAQDLHDPTHAKRKYAAFRSTDREVRHGDDSNIAKNGKKSGQSRYTLLRICRLQLHDSPWLGMDGVRRQVGVVIPTFSGNRRISVLAGQLHRKRSIWTLRRRLPRRLLDSP